MIAIGVTAWLQPAIEFAMVHQQHALAVGADKPRRRGEMTVQIAAIKGCRAEAQKVTKLCCCSILIPVTGVIPQRRDQ